MEKEMESGILERRTKKERLDHERKVNKMIRSLGGIKKMKRQPGVLFVVDPKREHIAIKEANNLGIPVVALCDTLATSRHKVVAIYNTLATSRHKAVAIYDALAT